MDHGCDETDISAFAWLGRDWEGLGRIGKDWVAVNWRLMLTHSRPTGSRGWRFGPVSGDHDSWEIGQYSQASHRGRLRTECGFPRMPC